MNTPPSVRRLVLLSALGAAVTAPAWDYEGHRMVNQVALAALPADFPAFVADSSRPTGVASMVVGAGKRLGGRLTC